MIKKHRQVSIEKLHLTNPQREGVLQLLASQKNKYRKLLHEAHERLHILADMTSCLEFWQNIDGHFEHISPACEKITGYAPADFFNYEIRLEDIIHPDSQLQFVKDKRKALRGKTGSDIEYRFTMKDGTSGWALVSWQPVVTRRGHLIGVRISVIDISRQKMYQELASHFGTTVKLLATDPENIAVVTLDGAGVVRLWGGIAERLTGLSARMVLGRPLLELFEEQDDTSSLLASMHALEAAAPGERALSVRSSANVLIPLRIAFTPIYDDAHALNEIFCFLRSAASSAV